MEIEKKIDVSITDCKLFLSVNNNLIFTDHMGKQYVLVEAEKYQQGQNPNDMQQM